MAPRKKKRSKHPQKETVEDSDQFIPHLLQPLISAIESPEGLRTPMLKCLYTRLDYLFLSPRCSAQSAGGMENSQCGIRVIFREICRLSDVLFDELSKKFELFFSALCEVSTSKALGKAGLQTDVMAAAQKINLLLRCCLLILDFLVPQQHMLVQKGRVLHSVLGKLSLPCLVGRNEKDTVGFEKSVSHECSYSNSDYTFFTESFVASLHFLEPSDPNLPFIRAMLEVFVDELLVHSQLQAYFKLLDYGCSASESLFVRHCNRGDIGILVEMISIHFCLSFSDEHAFGIFVDKLFCLQRVDFRKEISLNAAVSLLCNSIFLSAPKVLEAHVISLVSESIGIGMCSENSKSELRLIDCYLSAFERSVILYTKHIISRQKDCHSTGASGFYVKSTLHREDFHSSFESCIRPVTRKRISYIIDELDNLWHSYLSSSLFITKSDLITASIAYVNKNQSILDISCRDEIVLILTRIILEASSNGSDTALCANGDTSVQDLFLLASVLKLMSCSMLQVIWHLRNSADLGGLKTLKNFSSCKEYDSMVDIINCFGGMDISLPIQKSLCEMMESQQTMHLKSKLMFFHFSGLLSLSFGRGLDFLVKGCILAMMAVLNLFVFEEGNLDSLRSLTFSTSQSFSAGEAVVDQKSSAVIASRFQKRRTLYLSTTRLSRCCSRVEYGQTETLTVASDPDNIEQVVSREETEEMCNGEIFLKCILGRRKSPDNCDDLADFIECKRGKDYYDWLKDRLRYRKWKGEKSAILRWKIKKKTRKILKGKKS